MINVVVWNENVHERRMPDMVEVLAMYPGGIHENIAKFLREEEDFDVTCATLDMPECGLTEELLDKTDVLIWWSHARHGDVPDEIVDRVHQRVLKGMGLIVLHSSHFSKIFTRLMGTACNLKWRDNARERIWTIAPNHPIAQGVPESFVLENEEMYGEPFGIPNPEEVIFMGWFNGGEVFRSGCTWTRGNGKVFYLQPGHEKDSALHNEHIQRIIKNAVRWACPLRKGDPFPLYAMRVEPLEG